MSEGRSWKKVFEADLDNIVLELKEVVDSPCVVILSGDLGAGKTTFTKYFIRNLSPLFKNLEVTSPTFSVINDVGSIVHADFYRIEEPSEIMHLELGLYAEDKEFVLIEWGKKYLDEIADELGSEFNYYELEIKINSNTEPASRNISFKKVSPF